ncbi:MAG: cupin domain-containing protein [Actinomycetaceae bacterium]|nr:cupin domain-containing protein [Actinomycetaceae bacterium]
MDKGSINPETYRHGDWGPAYAIQGPSSDIGVLRLRPGDEMTNHIHEHCDETFVVIEGEVTLWVDCKQRFTLKEGDVYRCAPGEMHYFINESTQAMRLVFIKSPQSPGDTINLPWKPGEEIPQHQSA